MELQPHWPLFQFQKDFIVKGKELLILFISDTRQEFTKCEVKNQVCLYIVILYAS